MFIKHYRKTYLIFAALIIFIHPAVLAQIKSPSFRLASEKGFVKVPFELFENNILIQFRINNSQPVWCIFDTGASINVLDKNLAAQLGLVNNGTANLNAGGGAVEGTVVENAAVSLPGVEAFQQRIALVSLDILPPYFGRRVQGIIGTDFIKNFVVVIDHAGQTLTFYNYKIYNLSKDPQAIAIKNIDNVPYTEIELLLDGNKTIAADFELDTGSSRSLQINRPFANKNKILDTLPKLKTAEGIGGAGVGGDTSFIDARINALRIGRYKFKNPIISISQDTEGTGAGQDAGLIGTEIFRRFTVVLDYESQKILLKPNKFFNEPFESDLSGLELITGTNNFNEIRIKVVRKDFPANRAGLQAGDEIISINGRSIKKFNLDKLSKMFKQPGKEYLLTIKRQNKTVIVKLKLKRLI
ncbi:MAG: aspartyl protease family protein [Actinomycetota bacterium]